MRTRGLVLALAFAGCGGAEPSPAGSPPSADGGVIADGGSSNSVDGGASEASRCTLSAARAECSHRETRLTAAGVARAVTYEVPIGTAPPQGWPTVLFFQGTTVPGSAAFAADQGARFGQYQLTRTVKALLDRGFAVVAPNALLDGTTAWQTNIPPWSLAWTTSADHALMLELFRALDAGEFGPLDTTRLYAMGISSGGFMTSRMAVSYPGKFRALAVHSGSYATCSNSCVLPRALPADHPPTLFLHGEADTTMPIAAMIPYRDRLAGMGIAVDSDIDSSAGHEWLESGATTIPAWFERF
ncbi:MAG: PHB depolymerase family esterase [Myxococcota bacterium]